MFLFIFETIGTSELLLILVVALIVFGPRKLPQLSRQLGKSLADFRRASEDFKQTWEKEVARESSIKDAIIGEAMLPEDRSILGGNRDRSHAVLEAGESARGLSADSSPTLEPSADERAVARSSSTTRPEDPAPQQQPARKRDWL
ncbi:MAG: twin-arginine translocase TatA/TatE family subunit [Acidobacteriota bacterium]|nr:twin-arginine translocase TatA/TatE family subunit [Acidobacteriota bacterium]